MKIVVGDISFLKLFNKEHPPPSYVYIVKDIVYNFFIRGALNA